MFGWGICIFELAGLVGPEDVIFGVDDIWFALLSSSDLDSVSVELDPFIPDPIQLVNLLLPHHEYTPISPNSHLVTPPPPILPGLPIPLINFFLWGDDPRSAVFIYCDAPDAAYVRLPALLSTVLVEGPAVF